MNKRIFFLMVVLLSFVMPAHAVFDEKNIDQSIHVLHYELRDRYENIGKRNKLQHDRTKARIRKMDETMKKSDIIAMMLYSQKAEYIFGLTYACDMATCLYEDFVEEMQPLMILEDIGNNDVVRYDSIIMVLNRIDPATLSLSTKKERLECIYWANLIREIQSCRDATTKNSIIKFNKTKRFLYEMNIYAESRYKYIQDKMFMNGSETFYHILQHWDERWHYLNLVSMKEYQAAEEVPSDWSVTVRKNLVMFYGLGVLAAIIVCWIITFFILRTKPERPFIRYIRTCAKESRVCFVLTCASMLFAIIVNIFRLFVAQNFLAMALDLVGAFAWVSAAILLSSYFINTAKNVRYSMCLYLVILLCGLFVIFLRINQFPNLVVAITLPPVMLISAILEPLVLRKVWKHVDKTERILTLLTEALLVILVLCSWNGYILLTIQILTWWILQLTFIHVLASIGLYMRDYGTRNKIENKTIQKSWAYYFVCKLFCPVAAIYSVLLSIYLASDVFNVHGLVKNILHKNLWTNTDATISILYIFRVVIWWFVARYIYFVAKRIILKEYSKHNITHEQGQNMIYARLVQIFVYGMWFLVSMFMMHISMTWIAAGWAGLVTGMGFASRAILENIFYGLSLLSGRLKIGDLIKVGDVYGHVLDISYSSTVVRNDDGTVVTFTNSQLMELNYRNLTHNMELNKQRLCINVGIKTDIDTVRSVVLEATSTLPCLHLDKIKNGKIIYPVGVRTIGINSLETGAGIIIEVSYWVDPNTEKRDIGIVTECVINALRKNDIEIL